MNEKLSRDNFFLKENYKANLNPEYFSDNLTEKEGITHQPEAYPLAANLGERLGCSHIIDVGCGRAKKLVNLFPQFQIIGIDHGENLDYCKENYPFGTWIEHDLEKPLKIDIPKNILKSSVIICADVIQSLINPNNLLENLNYFLDYAPVCIFSTPERDLYQEEPLGPPSNSYLVREWNIKEFENLLYDKKFNIAFTGLTTSEDLLKEKKTILIILENNTFPLSQNENLRPPQNFTVVAIIPVFNEEDIIIHSVMFLLNQGIQVYIIENWSTDTTYDLLKQIDNEGLIGLERFPKEGPSKYFDFSALMRRTEELATEIKADWFMYKEVDEIRSAPWEGVNLREGIYRVDQAGFNAIDHIALEFLPLDNNFKSGSNFESYFRYFEFDKYLHIPEIKTWKNLGIKISLAESGGHQSSFEGRGVYPYKFLMKHYGVRSQKHGEKKILRERKLRWNPEEKAKGWHIQYDHIDDNYNFIRNADTLIRFDDDFYAKYLVERISGVGIEKNLFPEVEKFVLTKYHRSLNNVPHIRDLLYIYHSRMDLRLALPEVSSSGDILNLLDWAGKSGIKEHPDLLKPHSAIYLLMCLYKERPDLQTFFPEAANSVELSNLFCWAKNYGINEDDRLKQYAFFYDMKSRKPVI